MRGCFCLMFRQKKHPVAFSFISRWKMFRFVHNFQGMFVSNYTFHRSQNLIFIATPDSQTVYHMFIFYRETHYFANMKTWRQNYVIGSKEYLIFISVEYLIPHKHTMKILCKSKHFPRRYKRKRERVNTVYRMMPCKFHDDISNGSRVTVLTDKQTDRQTHKQTLLKTIRPKLQGW